MVETSAMIMLAGIEMVQMMHKERSPSIQPHPSLEDRPPLAHGLLRIDQVARWSMRGLSDLSNTGPLPAGAKGLAQGDVGLSDRRLALDERILCRIERALRTQHVEEIGCAGFVELAG